MMYISGFDAQIYAHRLSYPKDLINGIYWSLKMMSFLCIEKMTSDTVVPIYTIYTFTVQLH